MFFMIFSVCSVTAHEGLAGGGIFEAIRNEHIAEPATLEWVDRDQNFRGWKHFFFMSVPPFCLAPLFPKADIRYKYYTG